MILEGTLTRYLANHAAEELLLYVYGHPPEDEHAELLDSVA